MNWELFRQKIIDSERGKEEVAKMAGYANFKSLARAIDDRKSININKLERICNLIESHPATFLDFSPNHRKK